MPPTMAKACCRPMTCMLEDLLGLTGKSVPALHTVMSSICAGAVLGAAAMSALAGAKHASYQVKQHVDLSALAKVFAVMWIWVCKKAWARKLRVRTAATRKESLSSLPKKGGPL